MEMNDQISRDVAQLMNVPLEWVETIMRFEKKSVLEATNHHSTIEITDLGVLRVRPRSIKARLIKLNQMLEAYNNRLLLLDPLDPVYRNTTLRIKSVEDELVYLKTKKINDGCEENMGGLEEPGSSS